jgi:hypothetical protein
MITSGAGLSIYLFFYTFGIFYYIHALANENSLNYVFQKLEIGLLTILQTSGIGNIGAYV